MIVLCEGHWAWLCGYCWRLAIRASWPCHLFLPLFQDLPFCTKEDGEFFSPILLQRATEPLPVSRGWGVGCSLPTYPCGDLHDAWGPPSPSPAQWEWSCRGRWWDILRLLVPVPQLWEPFFHQPVLSQISHLHHLRSSDPAVCDFYYQTVKADLPWFVRDKKTRALQCLDTQDGRLWLYDIVEVEAFRLRTTFQKAKGHWVARLRNNIPHITAFFEAGKAWGSGDALAMSPWGRHVSLI